MTEANPSVQGATGEKRLHGYLAEFGDVDSIVRATIQVRDAGFTRWDVHTPFPVHGMDEAMGIRPTILPWISLVFGLIGMAVALLLQWWTNAHNYPYLISGKPLFSLPANIPIIFELTVLFCALATVASVFTLNRLPQFYHPLFTSERFLRVTDDKFFIVIESSDPRFDPVNTHEFLSSLGGSAVEAVED